jgi:DNA-directed RNA polymerase subunit N (RpoN/RPB10)
MESNATDKRVQREINALLSGERVILRETQRAVTPFGGLAVFVSFLNAIGLVEQVRQHMPIRWQSPNHIEPTGTFMAFLMSVLVGAKRFAHTSLLRGDRALHALLGLDRFPTDDTIRNLFRRFGMGQVQRLFEPLAEWQMARLPRRSEGYTLDLDSTVFERYGHQEGSLKGHNPRKHGRPSHHPLLAVLSEAHFLLHGWLRSGNCGTSRGVEEFLKEALALWGQRQKIRLLRADSGFFDDKLLSFLEQRCLPYIVVTRMTKWVKRAAQRVEQWVELDDHFAVGEFRLKLHGWSVERRFVVVRERLREGRDSVGRKLIDVPGYTFRIFVTSCADPPEEIWRGYNRRADMENRIAELKHDLGADGFCMKRFFATEAAFRAVLLLFNLLAEFQRVAGLPGYREPATIRTLVLTCGAILGRAGRHLVVHLSQSWGGLTTRIPLLDSILSNEIPTSPKLDPVLVT